ncbi:galactose mutarotase [Halobacillus litoralis]|uniref:aldose epimerase family protein n=1 Tax=Halobacillus litoralis TaxID=45668 RepID=UPI001CD75507|nr:aldose epimerase family protein [Halobacillus litoralis]MCA0970722.1 galactose mutarotase [Halobacillus litoralis]
MKDWKEVTLHNANGLSFSVLNYGGILTALNVPDRNGTLENVVLAHKNYEDYIGDPNYLGALIGRVAGRVDGSSFDLNGETYQVHANEGENSLHGGKDGLHNKLWEMAEYKEEDRSGVVLTCESDHLEGGYPGHVTFQVTYELNNDNQFRIYYHAKSNADTVLTLTNHSYFNLSGDTKRTVEDHTIRIESDRYVELDEQLIPTGSIHPVEGTPFDLQKDTQLGPRFSSDDPQIKLAGGGFDHTLLFKEGTDEKIVLQEPESGRTMTVQTDQPGVVFYTGNNLGAGEALTHGTARKHDGLCLETQSSPASLHHKGFPSIKLKAEEDYNRFTTFSF